MNEPAERGFYSKVIEHAGRVRAKDGAGCAISRGLSEFHVIHSGVGRYLLLLYEAIGMVRK